MKSSSPLLLSSMNPGSNNPTDEQITPQTSKQQQTKHTVVSTEGQLSGQSLTREGRNQDLGVPLQLRLEPLKVGVPPSHGALTHLEDRDVGTH